MWWFAFGKRSVERDMKICMICGAVPLTHCGVGDFAANLAEKVCQAGHEVTILTSTNQEIKTSPGIDVVPIVSNWKLPKLWYLMNQIKTINPDIVHIHYPSVGYGKGLAISFITPFLKMLLPKMKCVITLHEYSIFTLLGKLRLWPSLMSARAIICTNGYDQRRVRFWVPKKKTVVIPLGSVIGHADEAHVEEEPDIEKIRLLHFGTLMPNKGWETMIAALSSLKKNKIEVALSAISSLEPQRYEYHQKVADMIKAADLKQEISFTGYLTPEEIKPLMQKYHLVIMPFSKGLRLNRSSFIAMLSYHKVIITTDPGFDLEAIDPQETCWMVPPNNPQALANAIERLWQDHELYDQIQANAKEASANFSWSVIREKTLDLYHMI